MEKDTEQVLEVRKTEPWSPDVPDLENERTEKTKSVKETGVQIFAVKKENSEDLDLETKSNVKEIDPLNMSIHEGKNPKLFKM